MSSRRKRYISATRQFHAAWGVRSARLPAGSSRGAATYALPTLAAFRVPTRQLKSAQDAPRCTERPLRLFNLRPSSSSLTRMTEKGLNVRSIYAAMPSSDMSRSESFYEALIGRPADSRPMPVLTQWEWNDEIVLQIVDDAQRAGGGLATVIVSNMTEATAGLRARGISVEAAEGSVVAEVAVLADPDGNQITLIEAR